MDHEKISQVVENAVLSAFQENQDYVTKGLAEGLDWADGWEKTLSRAVFNAVHVSTRLSVQMALTILYETGVLEYKHNIYIFISFSYYNIVSCFPQFTLSTTITSTF